MFELFRRSALRASTAAPRSARLGLEALEDRLTPASVYLNPVEYGIGRLLTLSGTLTDTTPGFQTITLGGVVSGMTMTNSAGQFSVVREATGLGVVWAQKNDDAGSRDTRELTDGEIYVEPVDVISEGYGLWTFEGGVQYDRPSTSFMMYFTGVPYSLQHYTLQTDEGLQFEFQIFMPNTVEEEGDFYVHCVTAWGTESNWRLGHVDQPGFGA